LCSYTYRSKSGGGESPASVQLGNTQRCLPDMTPPDESKPLAQQCPSACVKDQVGAASNYLPDPVPAGFPFPSCVSGCQVQTTGVSDCWLWKSTGKRSCDYITKTLGPTCTVSDATPGTNRPPAGDGVPSTSAPQKAPDAVSCPAGTTQAGMSSDGVPLCVGSGTTPGTSTSSSSTTKPETTTTGADGSTVKTQVTDSTNPDGSVTTTTKTTTTGADGTVTVVVGSSTGSTPSGSPGKPGANGSDGKDAKGICETNPELTMCKNSTVSGDCDGAVAVVACTGDAIQCATLQRAATIVCKQRQDEADLKASALFAKGTAVSSGNDPDKATLPSKDNAQQVVIPSSLDSSGFAGGGAPFSDYAFSVQGHSFTIPFAKWTGYLIAFRYVMMIIAALVSFKILSGTILKD
jgi:hypothetical protein